MSKPDIWTQRRLRLLEQHGQQPSGILMMKGGAYTSWAKPAINEEFAPKDFDMPRDFVLGLMLLAGAAFHNKETVAKLDEHFFH